MKSPLELPKTAELPRSSELPRISPDTSDSEPFPRRPARDPELPPSPRRLLSEGQEGLVQDFRREMMDSRPPDWGRKLLAAAGQWTIVTVLAAAATVVVIELYPQARQLVLPAWPALGETPADPRSAAARPARLAAANTDAATPRPAVEPVRPPLDNGSPYDLAGRGSGVAPPADASARLTPPAVARLQRPAGPAVRGVTDDEIRFGMVAPFTGANKEFGRQLKLGIETAFNAANEAGGINGRRTTLVAADDGYEPVRTVEVMRRLYEQDQVFGTIGNFGSPTAAVAVPFALSQKSLFFGPFTGASIVRHDPPDRYVFNYRVSYAEEAGAAVRYLVKVRRLRPEQIAVFAQQDAFGDAGFVGVEKAMRALRGGEAHEILRLNYQRNSVDVDDAIAHLRASRAPIKAVVMVATYRAAAKFIEKTRTLYPTMLYTNVSAVGSTGLAAELMLLGPRYADGIVVTQAVPDVNGSSSLVLGYKSALARLYPSETPDYVSFEGYVTANIVLEALRRAGPQPDTEKVVDSLESLHDFNMGLGTPINFGATEHQASHKVWGTQLDATGNYQPLDLE